MPISIELSTVTRRILTPHAPFHFDGTLCKPSYFPGSDTCCESGHFWQSMRFEGECYGIHLEDQGEVETPSVLLEIFSIGPLESAVADRITAEICLRNDFDAHLRDFYDGTALPAGQADALLAPLLVRWRGTRPSAYSSLYEYLVIATVLQNATVRRTVQMMENLFARFGSRLIFAGHSLSAFWEPGELYAAQEEELRALKLGYRAKTLMRQATSFVPGSGAPLLEEDVLRALPTAELKKRLLSIYGVGSASVWYLLFGLFKRYDAFEYISPWEQKIFSRLLFDQDLVEGRIILDEVERRWGRWKMLAAHLLFEDLFWRRRTEPVPWLEELIRL